MNMIKRHCVKFSMNKLKYYSFEELLNMEHNIFSLTGPCKSCDWPLSLTETEAVPPFSESYIRNW